MLSDISLVLIIATVCTVSLVVFCTGTMGSCFNDGRTDMREITSDIEVHLANGTALIW
jgi:hypothetical protein